MTENSNIRLLWLKIMYIYTVVGAGGFGLAMVFAPNVLNSICKIPTQDPFIYGVVGSLMLTFGLLSIFGFRSPLKFVPVLLMQLCYKSVWFIGIVIPLFFKGQFPFHAILLAVIFATYIIGDLIALPSFQYFLKQKSVH